jgi:hypothetical protein
VHRFTDKIFTQDGAQCGPAIASARKRRGTGAFELNVVTLSLAINNFAEEERASIAELRYKPAELVSGVRLRQRNRSLRRLIASKDSRASI